MQLSGSKKILNNSSQQKGNPMLIHFRLMLMLVLVFSTALTQGQQSADKKTLVTVQQVVPSFKFEISKGEVVSIEKYRGKLVLINFFATWCAPCRKELPLIQEQIWLKHKDNAKFAMLTFGREHSWDEVLKFGKEQNLLFPLLPDPKRKFFALFATETIPRSFLIDQNGKIIFVTTGFEESHFDDLKDLINNTLKSII